MRWSERELSPLGWVLAGVCLIPLVAVLAEFDRLAPYDGTYRDFKAARLVYIVGALTAGAALFPAGAVGLGLCGWRVLRVPRRAEGPAEPGAARDRRGM